MASCNVTGTIWQRVGASHRKHETENSIFHETEGECSLHFVLDSDQGVTTCYNSIYNYFDAIC